MGFDCSTMILNYSFFFRLHNENKYHSKIIVVFRFIFYFIFEELILLREFQYNA